MLLGVSAFVSPCLGGQIRLTPRSPAEHAPRLLVDLETQGFQCLAADVGCEGVLYHPKHTLPAIEKYLHSSKM